MRSDFSGFDWLARQIGREGYPLLQGALTAFCVLGAVLREELRLPLTFAAVMLAPSQICLIALWAMLATTNATRRLERVLLWTVGLYFCILGPVSMDPARLPTTWPLWLALSIATLLAGTSLGSIVVRRNGWRLEAPSRTRDHRLRSCRPMQYRLWDAFRWMTSICVVLALGVMTIPRFSGAETDPIVDAGFIRLLSFVVGSGCVFVILGTFAALVFWMMMVDTATSSRFFRQIWWGALIVLLLLGWWFDGGQSFGWGSPSPFLHFVFAVTFGFGLPLAVNSLILREFGWRLVRAGRSVPSEQHS